MKKLLALLILIFPLQLFAQTEVGLIRGVITDELGAVFPKAKVKITPIIEGKPIEEKSQIMVGDYNGEFIFNNLPIGLYEVEITVSGLDFALRKRVNVQKFEPSKNKDEVEIYKFEPCSDILEVTDLTTENDKAEIVKEIIKDFSFDDKSKPILLTENIQTEWLSEEKQRFILMSPSEIQTRADTKGDFEYYSLPTFEVKGTCIAISWTYGYAQGKDSKMLYLSGEGKTYEFRNIDGKWVKKLFSSWVS